MTNKKKKSQLEDILCVDQKQMILQSQRTMKEPNA